VLAVSFGSIRRPLLNTNNKNLVNSTISELNRVLEFALLPIMLNLFISTRLQSKNPENKKEREKGFGTH
jgi:hypothetical protein